jgi:leader peptidase (prepilin peptidase)/N-methyltransferase
MTTTHHAVLMLFFAILGSCVGSFLNVCVYRIPRGMSVLSPRSRCPRCGTAIRARDNIPVLGWLLLRGRCRECRCAIPAGYAAVELAFGLLFVLPYVCALMMVGGDPWERIGAGPLLGIVPASWTVVSLGVFLAMVGRHRPWDSPIGPSASIQPSSVDASACGDSTVFRGSTSAHRTMPISAAPTKP